MFGPSVASIAAYQTRLTERLRAVHAANYPDCRGFRAGFVVVDGWRWNGCGDHCPGTIDGVPSTSREQKARAELRKAI